MVEAGKELSLADYLEMIRRYKWIMVIAVIVAIVLGYIYTSRQVPVYRSTVTILVEMETPRLVDEDKEVVTLGASRDFQDYFTTQIEILKSREIRRKAAEKLDREGIPEDMLDVEKVRGSWLARLSADHTDPAEAARVANAVAMVFVDENLARKSRAVSDAQQWLFAQSEEAERELQLAERELDEYRRRTGDISLEEAQDITVTRLKALNASYTLAQDERIAAESRYERFREHSLAEGNVPAEVLENELVRNLRRELFQKENEYRTLSERYTPAHPEMTRLSSQIEDLREKLETEKESVKESLIRRYRREYEGARRREKGLKVLLDEQQEEAMELTRRAVDYNMLRRSVDSKRSLHDMLLTRARDAGLSAELPVNNISIIGRAEEPEFPVSPNPKRNMAVSILLGLVAGFGLVSLAEYAQDTVKDAESIRSLLPGDATGAKVLASIPHIKDGGSMANFGEKAKIPVSCSACGADFSVEGRCADADFACPSCPKKGITREGRAKVHPHLHSAFGLLRTNLIYPSPDEKVKNILVTSPIMNDGKTFVSLNLAGAFTDIGKPVLIVGADLRKPGIDGLFHERPEKGLAQYLMGEAGEEDVICNLPLENLSAVPRGRAPEAPDKLLSSDRMVEFSEAMKERFDYIIYDTPPVAPVPDAIILSARIADRTVLIARAESTPSRIFSHAFGLIEEAREGIIAGVVLNDVKVTSRYGHYRYYGYYGSYGDYKTEG